MRISKYTPELLKPIIVKSKTWADVCRALSVKPSSGTQTHIRNMALRHGFDTSHFIGQAWSKGKTFKKKPLSFYLSRGSNIGSHQLKLRLIKAGLKRHCCEACLRTRWRGFPIPLELHHLNSNRKDNRIKNLILLCPNCHALTKNYCGKVNRKSYADVAQWQEAAVLETV